MLIEKATPLADYASKPKSSWLKMAAGGCLIILSHDLAALSYDLAGLPLFLISADHFHMIPSVYYAAFGLYCMTASAGAFLIKNGWDGNPEFDKEAVKIKYYLEDQLQQLRQEESPA